MTDSIILTAKMPMRMEPRVLVLDTIFVLPRWSSLFHPSRRDHGGPGTVRAIAN